MPIPSLPISVVGLILVPVDRKTLARRCRELDDQVRDPPLLATLQSCPALGVQVRKLDLNGWYQDWEAFEEDAEDEWYSDEEDGPPKATKPPKVADNLYLGQLLIECCTGLRRLEVHRAYLWVDGLVSTPRLVSLTFADGTRLRSRHKQPELLALPPIKHLNTGNWEQPAASTRRSLTAGISIMDVDDLGPANVSLFPSLTHRDVNTLAFRTFEELSTAMQQITPNSHGSLSATPRSFACGSLSCASAPRSDKPAASRLLALPPSYRPPSSRRQSRWPSSSAPRFRQHQVVDKSGGTSSTPS